MGREWKPTVETEPTPAALRKALSLCLGYMLAEVIGGLVSGSLALLADAGHMLTDAASLALALVAAHLAERPANGRLTYGYRRAEVLAATVNGGLLLAVGVTVLIEAFRRLTDPPPVRWHLLLLVAIPGLFVNLAMAMVLHRGHQQNLNQKAAFLHVVADTFGSLQVILAGLLVGLFGWTWADPLASTVIALLVLYSGGRVVIEGAHILMEGVPKGVDLAAMQRRILTEPGVVGVHDLHVWMITSSFVAATLHLEVSSNADEGVLWRVRRVLAEEFGIHHATIQMERVPGTRGPTLPLYPLANTSKG
ncbi:MAG: cation diffusion facilitator family transporter [Thermoanaerobaculum sp.]|nr:cation diffusion facilitator family transporter [Thermoanaerobaculum sp.]